MSAEGTPASEGAVWTSCLTDCFLRVADGGRVLDRVDVPGRSSVACALGGADRRTLFLLTVSAAGIEPRSSQIDTLTVDTPGAGRP